MRIKRILFSFVLFFALTFTVTTIVNFLWNLIFHEAATVTWETSFQLAIIFGILFTWMQEKGNKRNR
jgi:hypothetical protein